MPRYRIQQDDSPNGSSPYPFFVDTDDDGKIGRQDFWQGNPYRLVGFGPANGSLGVALTLKKFIADPERAIGLTLVVADSENNWSTLTLPVISVTPVGER